MKSVYLIYVGNPTTHSDICLVSAFCLYYIVYFTFLLLEYVYPKAFNGYDHNSMFDQ